MTKKTPPLVCGYWSAWAAQFYNHGGYLPCGTCPRCVADREALARVKAWNAATDAGADPRR